MSIVGCVTVNTGLSLLMRYSLTRDGPRYISSSAVVMGELLKLLICLVMILSHEEFGRVRCIKTTIVLGVALSAALFAVHNNILYYALSHLEVPIYQVTNQLKIFFTAIFVTTILQHRLPYTKWVSLAVLFVGISVIQIQGAASSSTQKTGQNAWYGIVGVSIASALSGFAGVYFEKILKGSNIPLWILNFYMSMFGFVFSGLACIHDVQAITENGFFYGWNHIVVSVVVVQACGGILVSLVVKFSSTIMKGFISSLSIVFSTIASVYLNGFSITWSFVFGSVLIFIGIILYQVDPKHHPHPQVHPHPLQGHPKAHPQHHLGLPSVESAKGEEAGSLRRGEKVQLKEKPRNKPSHLAHSYFYRFIPEIQTRA
uniref:Sugar phosphate transporter domain-containing protein n=1 Tax=Arcella intermedia TaxID=1963864 RepID=A0A6B2L7R3_9EUKA